MDEIHRLPAILGNDEPKQFEEPPAGLLSGLIDVLWLQEDAIVAAFEVE